jgi:hypothetical protein
MPFSRELKGILLGVKGVREVKWVKDNGLAGRRQVLRFGK